MPPVDLKEWCVHYVKARDAIERKLKSIDDSHPDRVVCTYKEKVVTFFPQSKLDTAGTKLDGFVTVVCLHNKANFDALVDHFAQFSAHEKLTIIFVNPSTNDKWLLKPAIHAAVADKSSLRTGLQSMYDTVAA